VRRIDIAGTVTSIAGGGATAGCATTGASTAVSLSAPSGVAVDTAGAVYIADTSRNCIRKVVSGTYSHVAGGGATTGCATTGAATAVSLNGPLGVAVDASGAVYVADTGNNCVRKIGSGTYAQVLGGGATTTCAAATATAVSLSAPEGVAVDSAGAVYVVDTGRRCVRRVVTGASSLLALTGVNSAIGDNGPAIAATMRTPSGIAVNAAGDVFVSDRSATAGSNRVRLVVDP
jgi:sugar lactone lactonase YvrE